MTTEQIILFLMTQKGYEVLRAVIALPGLEGKLVVVGAQDAQVEKDYFDEIREASRAAGIPFYERRQFSGNVASGIKIAVSWRWLIESEKDKLIVLHDSILPRYRGFAPLVGALINGEKEIGVTALYATEKYDQGAIIAQASMPVAYPVTIATAIEQISGLYVDLVCDLVRKLTMRIPLQATPQDEAAATYSLWRDEEDYRINWAADAAWLRRFVDAVGFPFRGASCMLNDRIYRILEVQELPDLVIENRVPGKMIFLEDGFPVVVCGSGLLQIRRMQDEEGNDALPLKNFRNRFK